MYKAGGYLLTFIFIGASLMFLSRWFPPEHAPRVSIIGAILTFACLALVGWGQVYGAMQNNRQVAGGSKFCARLEGLWWERIETEGDGALSHFRIEPDLSSNSVRLHGTMYNVSGQLTATWNSVMARVIPSENKIEYLWRGTLRTNAEFDLHGLGEISFDAPAESTAPVERGGGRFWSVDPSKKIATLKTIHVRRIHPDNAMVALLNQGGNDTRIAAEIKKTLEEW
jgi:hypothetical protein